MHTLMRAIPLASLLCVVACDVDDDTSTRVGDGLIGAGLAVDHDDLVEIDDLADVLEPTELVAWCDDVLVWNSAWATLESQVITEMNKRRAAGATCGGVKKAAVPALTLDDRLRCAGRKHSKDMGSKNFFNHTGSNGSTFAQRITSSGYTWTAAAENIAAGQSTAAAVVTAWMGSTGHCNNIMNGNYKHVGVGYFFSSPATYDHYWTVDFGKP